MEDEAGAGTTTFLILTSRASAADTPALAAGRLRIDLVAEEEAADERDGPADEAGAAMDDERAELAPAIDDGASPSKRARSVDAGAVCESGHGDLVHVESGQRTSLKRARVENMVRDRCRRG